MKGKGGTFKARSRAMKQVSEKKKAERLGLWDIPKCLRPEIIENDIKILNQLKQGKIC